MLFLTVIGVLCLASGLSAQSCAYPGSLHTVVSGDTLSALCPGCSVSQIQSENPSININMIYPGQVVCVGTCTASSASYASTSPYYVAPAQPAQPAQPAAPACAGTTYTVQSGDTLCGIAQRYGCASWQAIASASGNPNGVLSAPQNLQPGTVLCIPSGSCSTSCSAYAYPTSTSTYNSISSQYNCQSSYLNSGCALTPGQAVCIPSTCPPNNGWYNNVYYNNGSPYSGWMNGTFYCNGAQTANTNGILNCGGVSYNNGQVANGWVNGQFYCNGAATTTTTGTCGGLYYNNGNVANGYVNGVFYCGGVATSSAGLMNCGGTNYNNGNVANGMIGSTFYCNGAQSAVSCSQVQNCGGTYYFCGSAASGTYNNVLYSNGQVYCPSTATTNAATTTSCAQYAANNGISLQQLYACNPSLNQANCAITNPTTYSI